MEHVTLLGGAEVFLSVSELNEWNRVCRKSQPFREYELAQAKLESAIMHDRCDDFEELIAKKNDALLKLQEFGLEFAKDMEERRENRRAHEKASEQA